MDTPEDVNRDKAPKALRVPKRLKLPMVLTREEVKKFITAMSGKHHLMARLLYGSGLRLMECVRVRVHDIDFQMDEITVRDGKGFKDRITFLQELFTPTERSAPPYSPARFHRTYRRHERVGSWPCPERLPARLGRS